jgi:FkbM family methyltransferase
LVRSRGFDVVRFPVEGSLWSLLDRIFMRSQIRCVLDVGAHVGEYGGFLRTHGYRGEIVSFEPVPAAYELLRARASGDGRWQTYRYALGAHDGERTMRVAAADNLSSFLEPSAAGRARFSGVIEAREELAVEVKRLDTVFPDLASVAVGGRTFLKCDTQGLDLDILDGAEKTLDSLAGIQLELDIEPLYDGAAEFRRGVDWLGERGFLLAGTFPVVRDARLRLLQVEAVFVAGEPRRTVEPE